MNNITKKTSKFIIFFLLIMMITYVFGICEVSASSGDSKSNFDFERFENTTPNGISGATKIVNNAAGTAIAVARIVCVTIAVVILLVIAIKYMISSAGDRADIKKHAVHYVIGAFILFGVTGILGLINTFTERAFKE